MKKYGLSLLKVFMAFEVIVAHFLTSSFSIFDKLAKKMCVYAVPVFMTLSFIFMSNYFFNRDEKKITGRIKRLFFFQFNWAIIYFLFYTIANLVRERDIISINELIIQIITGHSATLNPTMWFQFVLIVLTILFYAITKYIKNNHYIMISIALLITVSYIMQYSGVNGILFKNLSYSFKYPLGRVSECVPFACICLIIGNRDLLAKLSKIEKTITCLVAAVIAYFTKEFLQYSFGYAGIKLACIATILIFVFYEFNKTLLCFGKDLLDALTNYTERVYVLHRLMGFIYVYYVQRIGRVESNVIDCMFIYAICYIASIIIDKLKIRIQKTVGKEIII